jgi:hypothetical protein
MKQLPNSNSGGVKLLPRSNSRQGSLKKAMPLTGDETGYGQKSQLHK